MQLKPHCIKALIACNAGYTIQIEYILFQLVAGTMTVVTQSPAIPPRLRENVKQDVSFFFQVNG